jgi:phenylalanyl-tRNA synthetase beta chain
VCHPLDYRSRNDGAALVVELKGIVDAFCSAFNVHPSYVPTRRKNLHPGRTADVFVTAPGGGQTRLGWIGQLHPSVAERFDLDTPQVLLAELNFERLLGARSGFSDSS